MLFILNEQFIILGLQNRLLVKIKQFINKPVNWITELIGQLVNELVLIGKLGNRLIGQLVKE